MIKKDLRRPTGEKYSKEYKNKLELSEFQKDALIGLLLGDVSAERSKANINTRLRFDQSKEKHIPVNI